MQPGGGLAMASLASYTTLYITAIRTVGTHSLENITAVRFDGGYYGEEEVSVGDLIRWLGRGDVRAYVRWPGGNRGPQVVVDDHEGGPCLRSRVDDNVGLDCLLTLPRWDPGKATRRATHRRRSSR
jgi:hypothetical protein